MKNILEEYKKLKEKYPKMRARNLAQKLNISEAELIASRIGDDIVQLSNEPEAILQEIDSLGEVMALTRNEHCVHERKGVYKNGKFSRHRKMHIGIFVNPDIDLRIFLNQWKYSFAVTERNEKGLERKSLQFFGKQGQAVHKIYLTKNSNEELFKNLVDKYKTDQEAISDIGPFPEKDPVLKDSEIEVDALRDAWRKLKDTHDFFPLLKKFKLGREQAFRLAGEEFAYKVGNNSTRRVLELSAKKQCEIMVFVGNIGCIQIHTGRVNKLIVSREWYNVLDPKFNLHLNEDSIANTWITKKPTVDGLVHALEVFDKNGSVILTLFGKRKPGTPDLDLWREILKEIPTI